MGTVGGTSGIDTGGGNVRLRTGDTLTLARKVKAAGARVMLISGDGVDQTGGALTAGNLLLLGVGDFKLNQAGNDVNKLAADIASSLIYRDADDLRVGTVAGFNGIATGGGNVRLRTGDTLTLNRKVNAAGARVRLNSAGGVDQTGGALTAAELLLLGGGNFNLNQAGNDVDTLAANIASPLIYRDADDLTVGTVGGTSGIATGGDNVRLRTGDTLTLADSVFAVGARVTLNSAGGVDQTDGWLTAAELLLQGAGDFTLDRVFNDIDTLAANIASSLTYRDWDSVTVGAVGGVFGIRTNGGHVEINAPFGRIAVNQPIDTTGGAGGVLTTSGDVVLAAPLLLGAGDITLRGRPLPGPPFPGGADQTGDYDYLRGQWLYDHMDQLTYKELLELRRRAEEMAGDPRWAQLLVGINNYLEAVVRAMEKATFYKP